MAKIIAISNQKGGIGKTTITKNLGFSLARQGKKVLLIDFDPQSNLTSGMGYAKGKKLPITITTILSKLINKQPISVAEGILTHAEGVDLVPADANLDGMEARLVNEMARDTFLKRYIETVKQMYDFILVDCPPSINIITINAYVAATSILIPTQASQYSFDGINGALSLKDSVRDSGLNSTLRVEGLIFSIIDGRETTCARDYKAEIRETYQEKMKVFDDMIPRAVALEKADKKGISIFKYDPAATPVEPFMNIGKEIIENERKRTEQRDRFRPVVPRGSAGAGNKKPRRYYSV